jgi:hypothetical protein
MTLTVFRLLKRRRNIVEVALLGNYNLVTAARSLRAETSLGQLTLPPGHRPVIEPGRNKNLFSTSIIQAFLDSPDCLSFLTQNRALLRFGNRAVS